MEKNFERNFFFGNRFLFLVFFLFLCLSDKPISCCCPPKFYILLISTLIAYLCGVADETEKDFPLFLRVCCASSFFRIVAHARGGASESSRPALRIKRSFNVMNNIKQAIVGGLAGCAILGSFLSSSLAIIIFTRGASILSSKLSLRAFHHWRSPSLNQMICDEKANVRASYEFGWEWIFFFLLVGLFAQTSQPR